MLDRKEISSVAKTLGMTENQVLNYAKAPTQQSWIKRGLDRLFGSGRIADRINGPGEREAEDFFRKVSELEKRSGPPPVIVRPLIDPPVISKPPGGQGVDPRKPFDIDEKKRLPANLPEILTPQSSNVYSFSYDSQLSTLYVTFKATTLSRSHITTGRRKAGGRLSRTQLVGKQGALRGRTDSPGARYAYFRVPKVVYYRMRDAQSKGKFVWDSLRVRGTIYGHRYQYSLVEGSLVAGMTSNYIPRKATAKGFRTRSIADPGRGDRGFRTSTLPQQIGFSTRRRR